LQLTILKFNRPINYNVLYNCIIVLKNLYYKERHLFFKHFCLKDRTIIKTIIIDLEYYLNKFILYIYVSYTCNINPDSSINTMAAFALRVHSACEHQCPCLIMKQRLKHIINAKVNSPYNKIRNLFQKYPTFAYIVRKSYSRVT